MLPQQTRQGSCWCRFRLSCRSSLKTQRGGRLIQVPDGYLDWVKTSEVHPLNQAGLAAYKEAGKVIFTDQDGPC